MRQGPTRILLLALAVLASPAISAFAADEPPLPDSRLGYRTAPLLLLSRADIRADLGLNSEQSASAERAIRSFYVHAYALRGKPNTPETKRERRAVDDEAFSWITTRLNDDQKRRLAQIDLQWEGPSALVSREVVSGALELSKEQVATLIAAVKRRNEARSAGKPDAERVLFDDALACLNESQRAAWKQMLGQPISFAHKVAEAPTERR